MVALPSGTVTFLFTDIEGSTVRWERDPAGMTEALAEHDALLRSTIERNGGVVFSTGGDGFAAAFSDAVSALRTAVAVQGQVGLPVRMGLHTGTAEERDGNYFGRTLNLATRIMSTGHGAQIVVSDVTAALIRDETDLADLGEHRLAGVERVMRLWQVGSHTFPPLRTSTMTPGNLPTPLDGFVGRTEELGALSELLQVHRLVTVVGVGGMGKTRLVVEACHRGQTDAAGGVWFVDLALAHSGSAVHQLHDCGRRVSARSLRRHLRLFDDLDRHSTTTEAGPCDCWRRARRTNDSRPRSRPTERARRKALQPSPAIELAYVTGVCGR